MRVDVKVDGAPLLLRLRNGEKRLAYAVVNAINETAKFVQAREREHAEDVFTIRKSEFIRRQVAIIKPFASVKDARPFADISVGEKPRLLLSRFEAGGSRKGFKGGDVAVPVVGGARPREDASVPEEFYFSSLKFRRPKATTKRAKRRRRAKEVGKSWEGQLGTYLVPGVGVFQRGSGEERSRLLYAFTPSVTMDTRLRFVQTAREAATNLFPRLMEAEVNKALARAGATS